MVDQHFWNLSVSYLFAARETSSLPTGWTLAAWGAGALCLALLLAGWAWMCRLVETDREGDGGMFATQAVLAAIASVIAGVVAAAWITVGVTQAGAPAWVPITALLVVGAVALLLVMWRRRRSR